MLTPAKVTLGMLLAVGGLVSAYVAKTMLARDAEPAPASRTVPMALTDLAPGTIITEAHIGPGYVTGALPPDTLISDRVVVGRVVKEPIPAATPIRSPQLYPPGERPELPLADGMRAVSVTVGGSQAMVDGLVKPGQRVDIHMTPATSDNDPRLGGGLTFTLLKGVKILAINRSLQTGGVERGGNTVTLELTPEQANIVLLATQHGSLNFTYNPDATKAGGVATGNADRATLEEILNLRPAARPFVSEHYRGSSYSTQEIGRGPVAPIPAVASPAATGPTAATPRERT